MEMWHIRILYVNKYTPEFHSCCEVNQIPQIMLSSISDSIGHKIVGKKICQKKNNPQTQQLTDKGRVRGSICKTVIYLII